MKRWLPAIFAALGLPACQNLPAPESSGPFLFEKAAPPVSMIVLHQALTLPAQQARVHIQGGREVPRVEMNAYYPNCEFEVRHLTDRPLRIEPDEFKIIKVVYSEELFSQLGRRIIIASSTGDGGGDTFKFLTRFYVKSDRQPDVTHFTCSYIEQASHGWHMTFRQFQEAAGQVVSLK